MRIRRAIALTAVSAGLTMPLSPARAGALPVPIPDVDDLTSSLTSLAVPNPLPDVSGIASPAAPVPPPPNPPLPDPSTAPLPIPEQDPFFAAPHNVRSYHPGEIIRSRPVAVRAFELPMAAKAWQLIYRTSDRTGAATVTGTTLMVPTTPWLGEGPRPLVSYQTAEDGVSTRCAPSYALATGYRGSGFTGSYSESPIMAFALQQGWALSVPDYEGMQSQFLIGDVAARGVLDGLRASLRFEPAGLAASPVAIWGYSGGAFASAVAAQMQQTYAPELPVKGVALGGLLGNVRDTIRAFDGSIAGSAIPMGMHGFARAYPDMGIRSRLNTLGQQYFDEEANDCLFDAAARKPFMTVAEIEAEPGTLDQPDILAMLNENSPLHRSGVPTAPVYEYHALMDEFAPIAPARAVLRKYCAAGVPVHHDQKPVGEHLTEIAAGAPGAMDFLKNRFAGTTPKNNCTRIPE
jgi:hypothetical protein